MKRQEVFDTVTRHLLTQGKKAEEFPSRTCVYHSPKGLKCAIGCLIPDSLYSPDLEGKTAHSLVIWYTLEEAKVVPAISPTSHKGTSIRTFLSDLQNIHDTYSPEEWRYQLRALATRYKLSTRVLKEFPNG